ncbi:peptidoglycan-binding protein [Rubneribacter badeniensis]|uniref:Peptidoglycan-binding protein n=1 Tax=Rubneribacter badeniensis TaxID=2070688 RepID=A0A2K2U3I3_9ACTN|nr:peptidoglycan-binding protein [Rubneribacter badeniensis]OUO89900.1 peptidoglycan-binding protein [Gordonibacter sp. An232A]PNV64824.1 peptidoglycan-binding protein [Rubneribacter badeniensis]CVH76052.1 Spore cortex-lytic enzyme precursor [Coriobacteriaceae bacterium CHKCI002]
MPGMETIKRHDKGPAVEDVQQRLVAVGVLDEAAVDGEFGDATAAAVRAFCESSGLPLSDEVTDKVWSALVDASFRLGDRTLYLRMPHFHGHDVFELQHALGALGFACGTVDGIFGAFTELALRKFQLNLGLPSDGIAGAYTYEAIRNLHHSWEGKEAVHGSSHLGFARAADVLEGNALCLFGTSEFTRSVASRMSNLALATNPASKIMSADSLLVAPDENMLLVHIVLPEERTIENVPRVSFEDEDTLSLRLETAIGVADAASPSRIAVELPGSMWMDAGAGRSAQHFAITLLDALCMALS